MGLESTAGMTLPACSEHRSYLISNCMNGTGGRRSSPGVKLIGKEHMNDQETSRAERQRWILSQSEQAQEERIAAHYTAFAYLAMQLRELTEARKHGSTTEMNASIRYLTGKIREGHVMEFGIQLEWPNAAISDCGDERKHGHS